jgi:hypothetical protein
MMPKTDVPDNYPQPKDLSSNYEQIAKNVSTKPK